MYGTPRHTKGSCSQCFSHIISSLRISETRALLVHISCRVDKSWQSLWHKRRSTNLLFVFRADTYDDMVPSFDAWGLLLVYMLYLGCFYLWIIYSEAGAFVDMLSRSRGRPFFWSFCLPVRSKEDPVSWSVLARVRQIRYWTLESFFSWVFCFCSFLGN